MFGSLRASKIHVHRATRSSTTNAPPGVVPRTPWPRELEEHASAVCFHALSASSTEDYSTLLPEGCLVCLSNFSIAPRACASCGGAATSSTVVASTRGLRTAAAPARSAGCRFSRPSSSRCRSSRRRDCRGHRVLFAHNPATAAAES